MPLKSQAPLNEMWTQKILYTMGNPVLTNDVNLYYIYYGNFTDSQKTILEHFGNNIGNSSWYNIERKYYFQSSSTEPKVYINGTIKVAKTVSDDYSLGKSLHGNDLPNLIQTYIDSGSLPEDTSAVYFVMTSEDVKETMRPDLGRGAAFCSSYCGYHVSWKLKSGNRIFYSQVGNPTACLSGCASEMNAKGSPNGDIGVDAMMSVIAHELVEAVSDPESDGRRAWHDSVGYENGDKCAWTYGITSKDENGATYNIELGDRKYLIQRNWDPETQSCANTA